MTSTQPYAKVRTIRATCGLRWAYAEQDFDHVTRRFRREGALRLQQLFICDEDGHRSWHDVPTVVETSEDPL